MNLSSRLIPLVIGAACLSGTPAAHAACASHKVPAVESDPTALFAVSTPLYVVQRDGRFFKADVSKDEWRLISGIRFEGGALVFPSPDRRWIVYGGVAQGGQGMVYRAYDSHTDTDRMILSHSSSNAVMPDFSPDGKYLALPVDHDAPGGKSVRAQLLLLSTADWRPVAVALPAHALQKKPWISVQWSKDGAELLVMLSDRGAGARHHYYAYHVASKMVEKVTARYDRRANKHRFSRRGRNIPAFAREEMRSVLSLPSATSPDGKWQAYPGQRDASGDYPLHLKGTDGVIKTVAMGQYNECEGYSLAIVGWLGNQHLVYRNVSLNYFVFDTSSGRTAALFKDQDANYAFTW